MPEPLTKKEIHGVALSTAMQIVHDSRIACELAEGPPGKDLVDVMTEIVSGIWEAAILNGSSLGLQNPEKAKKLIDDRAIGAIELVVED
jgi:hypothetical protein